jgi:uracil DNA glycosylase
MTIKLDRMAGKITSQSLMRLTCSNYASFLAAEKAAGKNNLSSRSALWFNALNHTPFSKVKVVIHRPRPIPRPHIKHTACVFLYKKASRRHRHHW